MKNLINHFFSPHTPLIFLLFFLPFLVLSQEDKRLALVIGNANYDKGELKNPVNDARLIAKTLDSLNFDVILKENLGSDTDFKKAVFEFGKKRKDYDVAFVYYAGHGVQINNINYLLPTKQEFTSEDEVELFGFSVQDIMKYLESQSDEVNVLILDACRDNPFESNWDLTRSFNGSGSGLAKIPAPTGSLIAFSTDAGQTAPDGDGENSVYTLSLAKNMVLEDISIDQVFRNVRSEVLTITGGRQRPVEATQLTGQSFYLNPSNFEDEFKEVDKIIELGENLERGVFVLENIIKQDNTNTKAYRKLSYLYQLLNKNSMAINIYKQNKFINLNEYDYAMLAEAYYSLENYDSALYYIDKSISIDSLDSDSYFLKALIYDDLENYNLSKSEYFKTIKYDSSYSEAYNNLALIYEENNQFDSALYLYKQANKIIGDDMYFRNIAELFAWKYEIEDSALYYYNKALDFDPENDLNHFFIARYYYYSNNYSLAIKFYSKAIELNPSDPDYIFYRGLSYESEGSYAEAISDFVKSADIYQNNDDKAGSLNNIGAIYHNFVEDYETALKYYFDAFSIKEDELYAENIGSVYLNNLENIDSAIYYFEKSIQINKEYVSAYINKGNAYSINGNYEKALNEYNRGLKINSNDYGLLEARADLFYSWNEYELGIEEYKKIIKIYPDEINPNYNLGLIYDEINDNKNAIKYYTKEIELDPEDPFAYITRGLVHQRIENYDNALDDFDKAISLDPEDRNNYYYKINLLKVIGDLKSAYNLTNETIEMDIDDPQGYYVLAELFYNDGEVIDALENIIISRSKIERDRNYYITNIDGTLKELYELYFFQSDIAKKLNLDELYCESMIEASLLFENSDNKYDEEKYIEKLDIFNKSSLCQ